ncbi:unnamed protein product, partial [Phaeothamnion confervicola]
ITLDVHGGGGVRALRWDPHGNYLASCSYDGTVTVCSTSPDLDELLWDPVFNYRALAKEVRKPVPQESKWMNAAKMDWHPDGSFLAIP